MPKTIEEREADFRREVQLVDGSPPETNLLVPEGVTPFAVS